MKQKNWSTLIFASCVCSGLVVYLYIICLTAILFQEVTFPDLSFGNDITEPPNWLFHCCIIILEVFKSVPSRVAWLNNNEDIPFHTYFVWPLLCTFFTIIAYPNICTSNAPITIVFMCRSYTKMQYREGTHDVLIQLNIG